MPLLHDVINFNPHDYRRDHEEDTINYDGISSSCESSEKLMEFFPVKALLKSVFEITFVYGGTKYFCDKDEAAKDTTFYISKVGDGYREFRVAGKASSILLKDKNGESLEHKINAYLRFNIKLETTQGQLHDDNKDIIELEKTQYEITVESSHLYIAADEQIEIDVKTKVLANNIPLTANLINYSNGLIVDFKKDNESINAHLNLLSHDIENEPLNCCCLDLGFGTLYNNLLEIKGIGEGLGKNIFKKVKGKLEGDLKDFTTIDLSYLLVFLLDLDKNDRSRTDLNKLFIVKYLALKNSDICFNSNRMTEVLELYDAGDAFQGMQAKNTENVLNFLQDLANPRDNTPYFEDIKAKELEELKSFFIDNQETFTYETQENKETWFQIITALSGILKNDNITDKVKIHVYPYLLDWLKRVDKVSKLQLTYNPRQQLEDPDVSKEIKKYAESHHNDLLKAACCLEEYCSKKDLQYYPFSYFASTLALDASMPDERNHSTSRNKNILFQSLIKRFNKFLKKKAKGIHVEGLLKSFSELTDNFIPERYFFVSSDDACYDDLAIMLYQLTSLLKNKSLEEEDVVHAKNIIEIYFKKIKGERKKLPEYVLYEDKKLVVESIIDYSSCFVENRSVNSDIKNYLGTIKDRLTYSAWDEAAKNHEKTGPIYYNQLKTLHVLLFVLLAGFSIFSMLLYTNAAASILLKIQLPFMISYGFLLKGAIGIVMPALSLIVVFFAYQAYKSIFTIKIDDMCVQGNGCRSNSTSYFGPTPILTSKIYPKKAVGGITNETATRSSPPPMSIEFPKLPH